MNKNIKRPKTTFRTSLIQLSVLHPRLCKMCGGSVISVIELEFFSGLDVSKSDEDDPGRAIVVQDLWLEVGVLARVVEQTAETAVFGGGVDAMANSKVSILNIFGIKNKFLIRFWTLKCGNNQFKCKIQQKLKLEF